MLAYPAIQSVVAALGGRAVLRRDVQSLADLSGMVEAGLPMRSLERLSASRGRPLVVAGAPFEVPWDARLFG